MTYNPITTLSQLVSQSEESSLPITAFPQILQDVIRYLQDGSKYSAVLAASTVLSAVSNSCQSLIEVFNNNHGSSETTALYFMTLGESGSGKTTLSKLVMKPYDALKAELAQEYLERMATYGRDFAVWKPELQALESKLRTAIKKDDNPEEIQARLQQHIARKPVQPIMPILVYNDTSLAALLDGLSVYPSAFLRSEEGSRFFEHCNIAQQAFCNEAWDGGVYDYKRSNREPCSFKPTLTVSLMLQPSLFLSYMKKHGTEALDSGFLSRFLFACIPSNNQYPSGGMSYRYRQDTFSRDEEALRAFHNRITALLAKQKELIWSAEIKKKTLKLSPDAVAYWEGKHDEWISRTMADSSWSFIKPMVMKASGNTLRIAASLHYFVNQDDETISLDSLHRAAAIMEWYLSHTAEWFYQFTPHYKFLQDVQELTQWIRHKFASNNGLPFKKNDVIKYGPNKFRRSDKLEPLLNYIMNTGEFIYIHKSPPHSAVYITWRMPNGHYAPIAEHNVHHYLPPQQDTDQIS
ncbi:hypothetical protein SS23_22770 [Enterobacter hormaechei subsp. steigerwaltii]|uniref:YfjI family protein n=1 Tax=Enterobacter hormaechei TaxID=158836 RepID=UPI0005F21000|nr:YfjI family protein [Enterobacter hormaechei]KJM55688.1 hypothetical protein SS23_22770 [Enterobacter hormaechei subsp. steigerwaltii]MCF0048044.1 DUF3987 domain-containing protein [Enterobacter hormaechei]PRW22557.1 hypothetical protein CSC03_4335 [Enterobacter hormaechei]GJL05610.1 hypothetical protein TUM17570_46190 [Enterobacter cloacae]